MLNLEGAAINRCDISGSNLNSVTIPASSSSSTTFRDVVSQTLFPLSDRKLAKVMKRKTKIPKKQKHQPKMQQLVQISSSGIQQLQQRKLLQQNQSSETALQDPVQVAVLVQQNVAKVMELMHELERQLVAMQGKSVETSEARLQQFVQQLLQEIQHFMHQVNQLPLANKSSSFSTIPQGQRNSLEVSPATDDKIPTFSNDESKVYEVKSHNRAAEKRHVDSTSDEDLNGSSVICGLQVTGAPVLLSSTQQDGSSVDTNVVIQAQTTSILNGTIIQGVTGISFQPVARESVSMSSISDLNIQSEEEAPPWSTLIHNQQLQSDGVLAGQSCRMTSSDLQVVTSSCQATNQQSLIQSRQLLESISVPGESRLGSVESTTPFTSAMASETALAFNLGTVAQPPPSEPQPLAAGSSSTAHADMKANSGNPFQMISTNTNATGQSTTPSTAAVASETALGINVSTVPQPPSSASGETRSLAAGSSVTTLPYLNVNSGTPNPSEMTSTDTIEFALAQDLLGSAELEMKHVDGSAKLESVERTIKEPEYPPVLHSSSPAGSSGSAPTCSAPIPAPHPVEASIPATHPSPDGALTCSAAISVLQSGQPVAATNSSLSKASAAQKPIEMAPASEILSHFANKPKQPQMVQRVQPLQLQQNASLATNKVPPNKHLPNKNVAVAPQPVPPTVKLHEIRTEPTANQLQREITPAPPAAALSPDDPNNLSESVLSLVVIVKPSKSIPDVMNQKKQETLGRSVNCHWAMDNRRFVEWLMQVGLLRNQKSGFCRAHNAQSLNPLQLRMYEDKSRFPHSGGYVWITKCCDRNFVSIFRDSIFEDATQPPIDLLKLMCHWSWQTAISNVLQWAKVDELYLSSFYTMMRSVCTVQVHSSTPTFGVSPKNNRVEVGVLTLGIISADGKRNVKVEILGIFEQETKKIRLRASEPIVKETESRLRFAKILEPLTRWVSPEAVILIGSTVDKTALEELGFHHVIQKTLDSVGVDDQQSNCNIVNYLRQTVSKVFQKNLSVLSTATIQQFLDELVWRESHGLSDADAFRNIIRDLSAQTRVDYGMPLIKRLSAVAADPFKDWSLKTDQIAPSAPVPITTSLTVTSTTSTQAPTSTKTVLLPSDPRVLAVGSFGTTPALLADINVNSGEKNTATIPIQLTSTATIGESISAPGESRLDSVVSTTPTAVAIAAVPPPSASEEPQALATGSRTVDKAVEASSAVQPAGASITAATGLCIQPLSSPLVLDSEADSNRDEALSLACIDGKEELVELLLSKGTGTEHRDKKGLTPLMLAASAGHAKVVEVLLNHGANIEAQDKNTKDTALALACYEGHFKVVELLLKRGANKEHHNFEDCTPLTMAACGGHANIIKLLLANAAEINSRIYSKRGLSPLMMAASNGHVASVRVLLEMGSDINATNEYNGYTALTFACFFGRHKAVQLLLENKPNVPPRDDDGFTLLQLSASRGFVEVGRVLLDYGADVNAPPVPSSRDTALTLASEKGFAQLVDLLLKRGALVDVKNKKGYSALWLAANGGHLRVVQLLYKAKADIDFKDNGKVSCLVAAFRKGHVKLVEWMVKRVTQFPSDEEISRIVTIADINLLSNCQLCKEIICAAKDCQAAEANRKAAHLIKELEMEKKRENLKREAAARKREKKKQKKQDKRRAGIGDTDNDLHEEDKITGNHDDKYMDNADDYTKSKTANPVPTTSSSKETEDEKSDLESDESSFKSTKSLTSTSITSPKNLIKGEEEWKEVVRPRPLSSQENSGSAAGTTKKSPLIDQTSATVSVIHSSERCKILVVPSNAIGRVIGYDGCNIKVIEEISGAVIDVEKQRKGKDVRTVLLMGMPEYISQAQQLILVLVEEPEEEFKKLVTKLKADNEAAKASGRDIPTAAPTEKSKNATFTSLTPHKVLPVSSAVKMDKKLSSPTAPRSSSAAPSYQTQPGLPPSVSVSMIATSVADMSPPTSSHNSTSSVQDYFPFNNPLSQVDGTSMSCGKVVNAANVPGYQRNLNASTARYFLNLSKNNEAMPFSTSHVSGPIGKCYLPLTPQLETVPTLHMEENTPSTSTSSLAPSLRMWRRQPSEQIQQHLFDELSVPNLTPRENGSIELPGQTFLLTPGVGRPQRARPGPSGLQYPPMVGDGASRLSDGDMRQLPHHLPVQNFEIGFPVPIGTSYREMELTVNLYPGPDVMTCTSDPSPNQPDLPEFSWFDETTWRVEDHHSTENCIGPWRTT